MKTTLSDGRAFRISFRHLRPYGLPDDAPASAWAQARQQDTLLEELEFKHNLRAYRLHGATFCWVTPVGEERSVEPQGIACLAREDQYDPETGRRLALARALQTVFPKSDPLWKEHRAAMWTAYFERGADETRKTLDRPVGEPVEVS